MLGGNITFKGVKEVTWVEIFTVHKYLVILHGRVKKIC